MIRLHLYTTYDELQEYQNGENFMAWTKDHYQEGNLHIDVDAENIIEAMDSRKTEFLIRGKRDKKHYDRLK